MDQQESGLASKGASVTENLSMLKTLPITDHKSIGTAKVYDRSSDTPSSEEIERIRI